MNKENIKELVKLFNNVNYKDLFGAIIVFEKLDYLAELDDLQDSDINTLETIYEKFMDSDITGLLNDDLKEIIDKESE